MAIGTQQSVSQLLEKAGALERTGHIREALETYEQILAMEERPEILRRVGDLHNQSGRPQAAVQAFSRVFLGGLCQEAR